jgi:dynein regulatory complex protein 1
MKWAELLEKEIPQELFTEIHTQMNACSNIIKSKDALISEFLMQLRRRDEEYVRALRQQAEDIDELLTKIRSEYKDLQAEYDRELDTIEDAYLEERDKIIQDHISDIDSLFDNRRTREIYYKESKQKREEQYQKEIDELISKGADQYNKLKIELEMNIQTLKQQLEEIQATYQLNIEKLDYNYRVLTELDVEKNAELSRYKRRLTKLKDQLNHLTARYHEISTADARTNTELTEDYRRLTQKYKDLQAKFRHFEVSDTIKFDEIWSMHEEEAKDLVDKLLKADKIISEQQLGWVWRAPDLEALAGHTSGGPPAAAGDKASVGSPEQQKAGSSPHGGPMTEIDEEEEDIMNQRRKISGAKIRAMLRMIASEAGFLVQSQVEESIKELPETEAELSRAEAMLRALGIKSAERVDALLAYFINNPSAGAAAAASAQGRGGMLLTRMSSGRASPTAADVSVAEDDEYEGELMPGELSDEIKELRTMIKPEDVIGAVRAFMEDSRDQIPLLGKTRGDTGAAGGSGKRKLKHMRAYWNQLSQIVSDESVGVWKQLEKDCNNYKEILERRAAAVREADSLATKNADLKKQLNQLLGDRSNELLQVPPAQTMRIKTTAVSGKTKAKPPTSHALMSKTH